MGLTSSRFHIRLLDACRKTDSYLCVGIDPRREYLPPCWEPNSDAPADVATAYLGFSRDVVDVVAGQVPIIKPQSAFFEALGHKGIQALEELAVYARSRGLLVLGDVKRGDIGTTAAAYAQASFREIEGSPLFDAVTVNPYLGSDGVRPFLDAASAVGGGVFVLCKTSNPSSSELQDLPLSSSGMLHEEVARLITTWNAEERGLVGAVVGGTHPDDLKRLRKQLPDSWILIPGIGAQGASYEDGAGGFHPEEGMALVSASRSITFPWLSTSPKAPEGWKQQIAEAVGDANNSLRRALGHGT